jgi:hypothetical protein
MEALITFLSQIDIANLLAIGAMFLYGYSRLNNKIEKVQNTVNDIDKRLCHLEGAFRLKECCLLKSDAHHKAAE